MPYDKTRQWHWALSSHPSIPFPRSFHALCPLPSSTPPVDLMSSPTSLRGFSQLSFPDPSSSALFPPPPLPPGKLGGQDSFESIESYDSCDRLTQSWSSQSSFNSLQRVPSYDSFDSEDYPTALPNHKPKGTFKDYVRDRADLNKDKPVIPAAALAGYTGRRPPGTSTASVRVAVGGLSGRHGVHIPSLFLFGERGEKQTLRGLVRPSSHSVNSH